MAGNIGFVFDQPVTPMYPYPPQQPFPNCQHQQSPTWHEPPFPPPLPPFDQGHTHWHNQGPPYQPNGDQMKFYGAGPAAYPEQNQIVPYHNYNSAEMATSQVDSYGAGHGQHGSGHGIPGGKLGVLGGAAVAGAGTALAIQLLPKKLKKNKLVKYGLPLAGAGAAGYKLNQMNNQGGKY